MKVVVLALALTGASANFYGHCNRSTFNVPGAAVSSDCPTTDGQSCAMDGSDNYHDWDGEYDSSTGKFSGTMTTNLCSNDEYGYCELCDPPGYMAHQHTASCVSQTFPATGYETGPNSAPLRGRVGLSVYGVNIYGPEEAGFGNGNNPSPCDDGSGECYAGLDVPTCESSLDITCAESNSSVVHSLMLDTCGGHAMPYHYHNDLKCDYDHTIEGHSPLIGLALDGYGVYGLYESYASGKQVKPSDLDTCNGHTATVPSNDTYGIDSSSVYHYHTTSWAPYTIGCYGPVESQDECKSLYTAAGQFSGCGSDILPLKTPEIPDGYCYDVDCPCFDGDMTSIYGHNTDVSYDDCKCYNKCDITGSDCNHDCDYIVNTMGLSCEEYYAPGMQYEGWCDKECGYGDCA
jgi:hypothetical protein